jgi:hypothetical protein
MWTLWTCRRVANVHLAVDFPARLCLNPAVIASVMGYVIGVPEQRINRAAPIPVGRKHCWGAPRGPHHLILGTDITA